mmetsp:Transcript_29939/g.95415  ORF Transcript_29939/g.95415 Transcript_29939/m.95415 type:complete len:329 (-) Transcript_29939:1153-2139(-)
MLSSQAAPGFLPSPPSTASLAHSRASSACVYLYHLPPLLHSPTRPGPSPAGSASPCICISPGAPATGSTVGGGSGGSQSIGHHRRGGERNAIIFTDHYSRFKRAYLLKAKSDAHIALDMYLNLCRSRGVAVRRLYRDGAGEFLESNGPMRAVLQRHGLLGATTTSAAHVHRQNGMAERNNRTLQDGVRARLIHAKLPPSFWWFALLDTIEIDSYIPFVDSPTETPYSRFHGEPPSVTHVRAFGCLAYPLLFHPTTKMAERATRAICLGRAPDQSAYVVYCLSDGRIFATPHVRFIETEYPGVGAARGESAIPPQVGPKQRQGTQAQGW